jgi:hypothetical protein
MGVIAVNRIDSEPSLSTLLVRSSQLPGSYSALPGFSHAAP